MAYKPIRANKGTIGGASDKVYTPPEMAYELIHLLPIQPQQDFIMDPCRGKGAFYNQFPTDDAHKLWCEIDEGRDFFDWHGFVEWIVTNPPYSIYDKFMEHCFESAINVCVLVPFSKVASSMNRIKNYKAVGFGIKKIWFVSAGRCGFPFGYPCGFVWFQRGCKDNWEIL